jgi:hypothetical protein
MVMKTTALIYGTPEQEQTVQIEFEGYHVDKWFGDRSNFFVTYLKVLDDVNFQPSDVKCDLEIAIAEAMGMEVNDVKIECDIFYVFYPVITPLLPSYETEMLFI